jgi:ABC-type Fe3+ transport system substrate-binding protein
MGSVEGAQAVLSQDKRIHVWSPASSLVQDLLVEPWQREHGNDPIVSDAPLALTPIVIVMWKDRYDAFVQKYGEVNFKTIAQALGEQTGWAAIANKPEWGPFKFGITSPLQSNSGLLSLVLTAYDYHGLFRGLNAEQVMNQGFLTWLGETAKYVSADESSTGKLMTSMLRFGPSQFDGVVVYENLALSNLQTAKGRWGELQVVYPTRTVWNDHPYYILDVPWSTQEQRDAAKVFQDFLLSKEMQRIARDQFLFRPANVDLPILEEGSAFNKLQEIVKINVPTIDRPKGAVLSQLMQVWKRVRG